MIYVDEAKHPYRNMLMCHMITDGDIEELHLFAEKLGLKRKWFQDHGIKHYDVSKGKREIAILRGAKPITTVELIRRYRKAHNDTNKM